MKNKKELSDEKIIELSEKGFSLIDNFEIIDNIPPPFKKVREERKEIIDFFDKLPENKVMKIRFPTEFLWKSYHTALRYYASEYPFDLLFNKRKDEGGYFLYIKKRRIEDEKSMEIQSI